MPTPTPIVEGLGVSHAQICDGIQSFVQHLAQAVATELDVYGVNDASLAADVGNYDNQGDDVTRSRWNWINFANLTVQAGYISYPLLSQITGSPLYTYAVAAINEVQTVPANGGSAGTFTLSYRGQVTTPLAYNAAAAAVQTALQALSTVGAGNLTVSGGSAEAAALVITAAGTFAGKALPEIVVVNKSGVTGGNTTTTVRTTTGAASTTRYEIDLWHEDSMNQPPKPGLIVIPSKDNLGQIRRQVIGLYKLSFDPIGFDGPSFKDGLKCNYNATALMSDVDEMGVPFPDGKKRIGRLISVL